jgi:predicted alpha/beta superfamily hydrolase
LQQDDSAAFICVPLPPESYGTMDLYVASAATSTPVNLHASAQVGERQRSASGWPEWTFGNQRDWYSPPVALSRAEVVDNRSQLTFGVVSAREVAIRKSKFGAGPWRLMIEIRALGAAKKGMLQYPALASNDDPASWATIGVGPVSTGPVGPTIISIDSRALGERREVWVDAPQTCKDGPGCDTLFVLDAHALFPVATGYSSMMRAMGGLRPITIVGVPSLSPDDRIRNFSASVSDRDRSRYPQAGGASRFAEFLFDEVAPLVAARFGRPRARVLAGHSLAGLFALESFVGGRVDDAIAISPTLPWNNGSAVTAFERWLKAAHPSPRRLFVTMADGDTDAYRTAFDRLRRLVIAQSSLAGATAVMRADEDHVTTVAPALQQAMLRFFAP